MNLFYKYKFFMENECIKWKLKNEFFFIFFIQKQLGRKRIFRSEDLIFKFFDEKGKRCDWN